MYLFPGDGRESCHVAKGSTDYLRQGMKDSAVCHAVVAFPDVMAGDNDENSIFESKRAKCEIGSGKFFSLSCQKSTKPFLDMCRKKLHSNATMTTDSLLSLSPSLFLSLKHFSHSGYLRLFFFHSIIILTTLSQPGKGQKKEERGDKCQIGHKPAWHPLSMSPASISPFVLRHFSRTRIFQIPAAVSNQQEIIKPLEKEKKKLPKMIDRGGGEKKI